MKNHILSSTISPSQNFFKYADTAVEEELKENDNTRNKRQIWEKMGNELEISGYPKDKISQQIQSVIETRLKEKLGYTVKINTAHYYRVMSKNVWQDTSFARNTKVDPLGDQNNSSLNSKQGKHYTENEHLIRRIDDFIDKTSMLRKYANDKPFLSLIPDGMVKDIFTRLDAYCKNFADYLNNKQTIPENTQLIFLQQYNACSDINNMFGLYFDEIKKIHLENRKNTKKTNQILTSKELKKHLGRQLIMISKQLDFATPNRARLHGFYGQQCPNCKGFRTEIKYDNKTKVICIKCSNLKNTDAFDREYFVTCQKCKFIYDDDIIKKKCPNCKWDITLPID